MTASKQDQETKTTTREMGSKVPVIIGTETVVLPVHQLHSCDRAVQLSTDALCWRPRRIMTST